MPTKWKVLFALLTLWFIVTALLKDGHRYCIDGSTTLSTRQGACSWHKGVGTQPELKVVNYIFLISIGVWGYIFRSKKTPKEPSKYSGINQSTQSPHTREVAVKVGLPQKEEINPTISKHVPADSATPPSCPKCGSDMVLRLAKKGRYRGNTFWGCQKYPRCNGVINCSDVRAHRVGQMI